MKCIHLLSFICPLAIFLTACAGTYNQSQQASSGRTKRILEAIARCPPWTRVTEEDGDANAKQELFMCLDQLAREETPVLRQAFKRYIKTRQAENNYSLDESSKLFVINRFLFNVPPSLGIEKAHFCGGWIGRPSRNEQIDTLWPWKLGVSGKLELVGIYHGYIGEEYQALEEFDFFNKHFGRRHKK